MGIGGFLKNLAQIAIETAKDSNEKFQAEQAKKNELVNMHMNEISRYDDERLKQEYENTNNSTRKYAAGKLIKKRIIEYKYQYEAYGDQRLKQTFNSTRNPIQKKAISDILKSRKST